MNQVDTVADTGDTVLVPRAKLKKSKKIDDSISADTVILSEAEIKRELQNPTNRPKKYSDLKPTTPGPKPVLGVAKLLIGSHDPIPLDRPTIVGRLPNPPRIRKGREPRLVMVPSPKKEISASHVKFEMVGNTVVVSDLGSTNGTSYTPVGGNKQLLRQGESKVILDGTIVEIGDGIQIVLRNDEEADGNQESSGN